MITETVEELRRIARSCDDGTGYFPAMYARVTAQIAQTIDGGGFADGTRMDEFATRFAKRYTRARRQELPRPACWQASWDVATDGRLLIVQHLLLGINAHVNFDLPQAVVEIARREGDLEAVRGDFDAVNAVLAATSVGVLGDLDRVSRWVGEVAAIGGGRMFNFSLRVARDQAWAAAERLFALDDAGHRAYVRELDELVSVLAYLIVHPSLPVRVAAGVARRFEERNPRVVTRILLDGAPKPNEQA